VRCAVRRSRGELIGALQKRGHRCREKNGPEPAIRRLLLTSRPAATKSGQVAAMPSAASAAIAMRLARPTNGRVVLDDDQVGVTGEEVVGHFASRCIRALVTGVRRSKPT
jgi:hypothetical protein